MDCKVFSEKASVGQKQEVGRRDDPDISENNSKPMMQTRRDEGREQGENGKANVDEV